jgi:hypothetical protein
MSSLGSQNLTPSGKKQIYMNYNIFLLFPQLNILYFFPFYNQAEFYPEVQQNLKIKTAQSICTVS